MKKNVKTSIVWFGLIAVILGGFFTKTSLVYAAEQIALTKGDFAVDKIILLRAIQAEKAIKALHPMNGSFFGPTPVGGGFASPTMVKIPEKPVIKDEPVENETILYGPAPVNITQVAQDQRS